MYFFDGITIGVDTLLNYNTNVSKTLQMLSQILATMLICKRFHKERDVVNCKFEIKEVQYTNLNNFKNSHIM